MQEGRKYKSFPIGVPKNKFLIHTHPHPLVQLKKSDPQSPIRKCCCQRYFLKNQSNTVKLRPNQTPLKTLTSASFAHWEKIIIK